MPRPRKCRKICDLPNNTLFAPQDKDIDNRECVTMTVDEYETIRLIDYEKLTQEECAKQMNVARTTVQRIYNIARGKIAKVLINGLTLKIEGGDYVVCNDKKRVNGCGNCHRKRMRQCNDNNVNKGE